MLPLLAWIYSKIADARNALYDRGIFEVHDLGVRTISVGNLTTGGTGKTPLVAYVAELLAARGEKVCILTRGYGRDEPKKRVLVSDGENILDDPRKTGDEPVELAYKLKGKAIVIADADRAAAGEWARRRFGVTAFVLDDGFQHRKVRRDVDIICIDATQPFAEMRVLPAGRLREPLNGLSRAGAIVITRTDLVDEQTLSHLKTDISELNDSVPIFEMWNRLTGYRELHSTNMTNLTGKNAYAVCGLGNPESFFEMLKHEGLDMPETWAFADHHSFSQVDIDLIENDAQAWRCEVLVITAKDAVKLEHLHLTMPCYVAEIEVKIDDAEAFSKLI